MAGFVSLPSRVLLVAAMLLLVATSAPQAQERVGVSSAVNPEATGAPPGAAPRKLVIGQPVIFNEHITTGAKGQTQLLFLDESAMTVGPNSDLTIDQFVYDPKSGTGKLAMSATRGLLRYVGGKLSKNDGAVTLHTTTATLAVRGGAFMTDVDRTGKTEAIFIFGDGLTVTGRSGISKTLLRPGYAITVGVNGVVSDPFAVPAQTLAAFLQELNGRPGGSGGATVVPTDTTVVDSGLPQTISVVAAPTAATTVTGAQQEIATFSNSNPTHNPQPNSAGQVVSTCTSEGCSSGFATPINQSPSPTPTPTPTPGSYAGRVKNTNGNGTARGFVDQTANGDAAYKGGSLSNGVFTADVGGSLGTISFPLAAGNSSFGPSSTSSSLGSFSGSSFLSSDGSFFYASLTPTSDPSQRLFITGGLAVNSSFYDSTGSARLFAFTIQPDAALGSNIPFVRPESGGNLVNASVSPLYVVAPAATKIGDASTVSAARALQGSLAIDGTGANQRSTIAVSAGTIDTLQSSGLPILNGQMRGSSLQGASGTPVALRSAVSSMVDANGNSFYGASTITGFGVDQTAFASSGTVGTVGSPVIPSTASEVTLSQATTSYGFAQAATSASVPTGVGATRTTQTLTGNLGGLMYTGAQSKPYILTGGATISTDASGNQVQATLSGTAQSPSTNVNTVTMQYGGLTGNGSGTFVDDRTFAATESQTSPQQINGQTLVVNGDQTKAGQLYLASSGVASPPTSLLPTGASYCQCKYLQWGYWGGDLLTGDSTDSTITRVDRGHINTWVAGVPTPLSDLSSMESLGAIGTYNGHAFGSVFNNGSSYVAAGGFNATYHFGTQTGTFSISNFDGHTFSGTGSVPLSGANYTFGFTTAGFKGGVNGTFYGPNAAETGGSFAIGSTAGPAYLASGIYAGAKQ
jgi:trimeric autotransporter adhesin